MKSAVQLLGLCVYFATAVVPGAFAEEKPPPAAAAAPAASPAETSFWEALKRFRSSDPEQLKRGRAALEFSADRNYGPALLMQGECYQAGAFGFSRRAGRAADAFQASAETGNGFAMVKYAACLQAGAGVRRNAAEAMKWLKLALEERTSFAQPVPPADFAPAGAVGADGERGVAGGVGIDQVANARAQAHYLLGLVLQPQQPAEAQSHFLAAAAAGPAGRDGIPEAAAQAALAYAFGKGIPKDRAKAIEMLNQRRKLTRRVGVWTVNNFAAAKLVDDFAVSQLEDAVSTQADAMTTELQFEIARQLTDRKSKDYNPQEAVQWLELAAESGQPWPKLELGFLYARGDLGQPDPAPAFKWFEQAGSGKPMHLLGVANTVICLMHGLGTTPDRDRALKLAQSCREADIVCHLATIGQCPAAVVTFEQELALNQTWAEDRKDAQAQCLLAIRYLNGAGVKADLRKAEKWLKRAVKQGNGQACRLLGFLCESKGGELGLYGMAGRQRAEELYAQGAAVGDDEAACNLAHFYASARVDKADEAKSDALLEQVLKRNPTHARALNNLGASYERRMWRERNRGEQGKAAECLLKAVELYKKSDEAGLNYAANNLGRLYRDGEAPLLRDYEKAYGYFLRSAEAGNNDARLALADMLESGQGVPVSMAESAYHLRMAAVEGNTVAMRRLGEYYLFAKGGVQDLDRALFWMQQGAVAGDSWAATQVADILLKQKRHTEAIKLLEAIAARGALFGGGFACERLSVCYWEGTGVNVDKAKAQKLMEQALSWGDGDACVRTANYAIANGREADALRLFKTAAEAGNPDANYALGQMAYFGQHGPKDMPRALECFRKAARKYHPGALYFLAGMTANHDAGAPTLDEAIQMARSAEALGNTKATELREILERRRLKELAAPVQTTDARAS